RRLARDRAAPGGGGDLERVGPRGKALQRQRARVLDAPVRVRGRQVGGDAAGALVAAVDLDGGLGGGAGGHAVDAEEEAQVRRHLLAERAAHVRVEDRLAEVER